MSRLAFPLHDSTGTLWPECDWREVGAAVMAAYLDVSRMTIWERTGRKVFGLGRSDGVWLLKRRDRSRGQYVYVPGRIWMAQRIGRYADPRFDWRQVPPPPFQCDPVETRERYRMRQSAAPAPVGLPIDVQARLVQCLTEVAAANQPINGPRLAASA
jgi:hypothetical protein